MRKWFIEEGEYVMKDLKKKCMKWGMLLLLLICGGFAVTNCKVVTVQAESQSRSFRVNGRTYIEKQNIGYYSSTALYQKVSGRTRQVAKISKFLRYRFSYGKKLYFSGGGEGTPCVTYTYTIGRKGFKLERNNMMLTEHRGRYAVGYITLAGDPSPSQLCFYNLARKKMTKLGRGCDIQFIGNKIYYASVYNKNIMQIVRRNANCSGKKVLKTVRENNKKYVITFMGITNSHSAWYYSYAPYPYGGPWKRKTVRF